MGMGVAYIMDVATRVILSRFACRCPAGCPAPEKAARAHHTSNKCSYASKYACMHVFKYVSMYIFRRKIYRARTYA